MLERGAIPPATQVRRRILKILARTRQLWRFNFTVKVEFAGELIKVPFLLGEGRPNLAMYESWLFEILARVFAVRPGAFLDVGANVGQTLLKSKILDPDRPYVGFEPNPRCCFYLEQLIRANAFRHCTIVPAGLADRSGLVTLLQTPEVDVDTRATVISGFSDDESQLVPRHVAVLSGDETVQALGVERTAAVKVDVEGGELEVLQGLSETIGRDRPYIVVEILPVIDASSATGAFRLERQRRIEALMRVLDYRLYRIGLDASLQPIDDIEVHSELALSNYLAVPRDGRAALAAAMPGANG